tara:strand:+ start:194 stop:781 length:588 start_codon:yes stop_codon:yes gene_type:complete
VVTNKSMKRLSLYLFLVLFALPTPSQADDIRDFQIEGMSIGDSLLDYLSYSKIKSLKTSYFPNSKKYIRYYDVQESNTYGGIDAYVLDNDKNFIVQSLTGYINYYNNIEDCYPKKKEIVKTIGSQLAVKGYSYVSNYDNDTSKSDVTDFDLTNGSIRIWCTDYSKEKEDRKFGDFLSVNASKKDFLSWVNNEAYK